MLSCLFQHDVDRLIGVDPEAELPERCSCGERINYAPDLMFISWPPTFREDGDWEVNAQIHVSVPLKFIPISIVTDGEDA